MRRNDRELDFPAILSLLDRCHIVRLAMIDGSEPYIVPLNYGYTCEDGQITLYCHSANEGRKLNVMCANPLVGFEMDTDYRLLEHEEACRHSNLFSSVIGTGEFELLEGDEKKKALSVLMHHQTGRDFCFTDEQAASVAVFAIRVKTISGKAKAK
ncbi:MAG: pyridoxamine 5'-phosphate oxidase family protein [Eubacteriales bacterium]|nr:pyridoxamine 5'-phosphate oxidase family protein [Eubacteriales bacterium]